MDSQNIDDNGLDDCQRLRLEIVSVLENGSGFINLEHAADVYDFIIGD